MLFSADGLEINVSGVILYDETVDNKDDVGTTFPRLLDSKGIVPGIKVDTGKAEHPDFAPQTLTHGLDGLAERLKGYDERGGDTIRFTKWRQVILVEPTPEDAFLEESMDVMAKYAKTCQEGGYVPIVEPEVLMDGTHTQEQCEEVTERTLKILYKKLEENGVDPAFTLLKPNMVVSGKELKKDSAQEVAEATLRVFENAVPSSVPGIVFLSGGQTPEQATENLNAINVLAKQKGLLGLPTEAPEGSVGWFISYSYGRALQQYALKAWGGDNANIEAGQAELLKSGAQNGAAQKGEL